MNQLDQITQWIKDAGQEPGVDSMGLYAALCAEETAEMLDACSMHADAADIDEFAYEMRKTKWHAYDFNRPELLDAACDLIWVATGLIYAMGVDPTEAMARVIASNDSKRHEDGTLQKDATGKVIKPAGYLPPDFSGLLED